MKYLNFLMVLFLSSYGWGQNLISGKVVNVVGEPVPNINVTLVGTYDGASTDQNGEFSFETDESGEMELELEGRGYASQTIRIQIPLLEPIEIELEEVMQLETAVFMAGTMRAVGNTNETMMTSLDVVTTAGSNGDIIAAMQTLPGTNNVSEDGRLFIRGGESEETSIFIDRLRVFQPYTQNAPNTPARGRYSPFLFKGMNFSTGGYDASYGQALSGILSLETLDFPTENSIDLSFMTLGLGAALNKVGERDAITISTEYYNLWPIFQILKTRDEWKEAPTGYSGEAVYRHKFEKGLYKSYLALDYSRSGVLYEDINFPEKVDFRLNNTNLYWNNSYVHNFSHDLEGFLGFSLAKSISNIDQNSAEFKQDKVGLNAKAELNWKMNSKHHFQWGTEFVVRRNKDENLTQNQDSESAENLWAVYAEYTWYFAKKWGLKTGLRGEYSDFVEQLNLSPRVSLAYKPNKYNNVSVFYGLFNQSPMEYIGYNHPQNYMYSDQLMVNYFYQKEKQTIRLELYQKNYKDLVRTHGDFLFTQDGKGYSRGVDFFWRNNGSYVKNLQYWISYSYIDTQRLYKDFPVEAQPSFVANHNLTWVGKYWIQEWRSQIGFTYQFASGRPYNNPNTDEFLSGRTKSYHTFNINWAYLMDPQKILYFSFSNPLGIRNVTGYNYSHTLNEQGFYDRMAVQPSIDRFFFIGFFWTISENKNRNQLDTL